MPQARDHPDADIWKFAYLDSGGERLSAIMALSILQHVASKKVLGAVCNLEVIYSMVYIRLTTNSLTNTTPTPSH